jgi:hypothetical protein
MPKIGQPPRPADPSPAPTLPGAVTLAFDTEFKDTLTLTVQVAARLDDGCLAVQLYHSPSIPSPPPTFDVQRYLPRSLQRPGVCERVILRPVQPLTDDLSPGLILADVLDLKDVRVVTRANGDAVLAMEEAGEWPHTRRKVSKVPCIDLTLVGHFLRVDIGRLFGTLFWDGLRTAAGAGARVCLGGHKVLGFREGRRASPILNYLLVGGTLVPVRVTMRDTILPYGGDSLDKLSKRFLGVGKSRVLAQKDKADMLSTFRTKPEDAYGYAAVDALHTLLVHERMQEHDRGIYTAFGVPPDRAPALRPTLGGRVSTFLQVITRETVAAGSECLRSAGLEDLLRKGGLHPLEEPGGCQFGGQAARLHGALLFSRSATRLAHLAPGMLADVDMSGCYLEIARSMNVYWGRPVVLEPGAIATTLKDAVNLVRCLAPDDGWLVYVSGTIGGYLNSLIPSLEDAVTGQNYLARRKKARRRDACDALPQHPDRDRTGDEDREGTRLYTHRVDFGLVAWPTWLMIQALPPVVREEYERLRVDAVVFYPRHLIAADGREYDRLVRDHPEGALPWETVLDQRCWELVKRIPIRADHVSLRLPLGEIAGRIKGHRQEARRRGGKGGAEELAWKQHGNTLFGVLASPHKPTHNFVAANIITATARDKAFALSQVLNAIQTITDGCTYRRDQIPACTYEDCLRIKPDYPVSRGEEGHGIPFLEPGSVPQGDEEFTRWFVDKAQHFFNVQGPEYQNLFGSHVLEHKTTGKDKCPTFDGLCCDGPGNYLKVRLSGNRYRVEEFKARGYQKESKEVLKRWMVQTYFKSAGKRKDILAPLTCETGLLSLDSAMGRAKAALAVKPGPVYLPLGLASRKTLAYKIVKLSAFVFGTPEQRVALLRQLDRFQRATGCGLEVLALRRSYGGRMAGDIEHVLQEVEKVIRSGGRNLTRALHLNQVLDAGKSPATAAFCRERRKRLQIQRATADADLRRRITSATAGLLVHAAEVERRNRDYPLLLFLPARPTGGSK